MMASQTTTPAGTAMAAARIEETGRMEPGRKVNVLLVDDQPSNLLALEAILDGEGLNLVRAYSGEQALLRVLDEDFAAILMDVQMPGMDGFEAAELIRERDRSRHTPILFLTAFQSNETQVARGYALGAVDFLAKPILPMVLRAKVAAFVDLFVKGEQIREQARRLVETERQEHLRALADEKRRWEIDRLREEAAREKHAAEELAEKARELTRSIEERIRAEEQLRQRATQQEIVVELGQVALAGNDLGALLAGAVASLARGLGTEFARVMELDSASGRLVARAAHGWPSAPTGPGEEVDSLAAFAIATGEPVVIDELGADPRFDAPGHLRDLGVVSGMSVVVLGRDRPFGTIGAFTARPRSFSRDDVNFLQAVANVLAAAIQRVRDEAELAAVRDELEIQLSDMTRLHALGERLADSLELTAVLERVLEAATGLQGAERGVLMLHDRSRQAMTTAASVGFTPEELADADLVGPATGDVERMTAVIGGGLVVEEFGPEPVLAPHLRAASRAGCRTVCSMPLLTCGGELVGTIATYFPEQHRPSPRETRLVELYARQAAEFIENANLYREIREADRRKGEFLAMLAHELRNPLAPILNALHLLRLPGGGGGAAGPDDDALGIAERQVRHLARLVDDLLDVSRINTGKVDLRRRRVDLRDSASRVLETARPLLEAKRHEVSLTLPDEPIPLLADPTRLEQVLSNLLNNAAKYTEPGGRIALEVAREGGEAVATIRDNGIGMDPELVLRAFELFAQAERSLDRSQGGLGIGLTLVRRLVEMHGGTVEARSAGPGLGSEFTVRIPLAPAEDEAPFVESGDAAPEAPEVPRRFLIVDDNIDAARMLARLLKAGGHQTDVAHDGLEALEVARRTFPDIILLDIGLPGLDGYEVARRLRRSEGLEGVLLVAVTGYGQAEDRARAHAAGFDHHLVKPVDPHDLGRLIRMHPARA